MKNKYFILIPLMIFILNASLQAGNSARLQLAVAAPDPVKAGEDITFQVILINDGPQPWARRKYKIEVELFDSRENFLKKLTSDPGPEETGPGESALFLVEDILPESYSGRYFYRITARLDGDSIFRSDMHSFLVQAVEEEVETVEEVEPGWNVYGSLSLSNNIRYYDYASESDEYKHRGHISFNTMGDMPLGVFTFNMTGSKPEDDRMDLYSLYGSLSSDNFYFELGDIMPYYSQLVLDGQTGRGIHYSATPGILDIGLMGMMTVDPVEGSEDYQGVYARYMSGVKASASLGNYFSLTGSGLRAFDDTESLSTPGPGAEALNSDTFGGRLDFNRGSWDASANAAYSTFYIEDENTTHSSTSALAVSGELRYRMQHFDIGGRVYEIQPGFSAPGSPRTNSDRRGYRAMASFIPARGMRLNYNRRGYRDNLDELPVDEMETTYRQADTGNLSLVLPGWPSVTLRGGRNAAWSEPEGITDNQSLSGGFTMGYNVLEGHFVSLSYSLSDYKDNTGFSADLFTYIYSLNYSASLSERLNLNSGFSYNDTENKVHKSNSESLSVSLGTSYRLIPGRLNTVLYNSLSMRKDNHPLSPSDTRGINSSVEFNLRMNRNFTLAAGGSYTGHRDRREDDRDYDAYGLTARGLYNF